MLIVAPLARVPSPVEFSARVVVPLLSLLLTAIWLRPAALVMTTDWLLVAEPPAPLRLIPPPPKTSELPELMILLAGAPAALKSSTSVPALSVVAPV